MYAHVGVCCWCVGLYPLVPMESQRCTGSMNIENRKGERVSHCNVPRCMGMVGVSQCGVI